MTPDQRILSITTLHLLRGFTRGGVVTKGVNPDNSLTTPQLKPHFYLFQRVWDQLYLTPPTSVKTTLLFISKSLGSAVPDPTYSPGAHRSDRVIPGCPRLHQAIGVASAQHCASAEPPGLAVQAKRS